MDGERIVCWFSCGATSAIATKIALEKYQGIVPVDVCYCDTGGEHDDNMRFLKDMEAIYGQPIKVLKNPKFDSIWDVWEKRRYIAGVRGAPCTYEMKIKVREDYQRPTDIQVFGFDAGEISRKERFESNHPTAYIECPLIDTGIKKLDCLDTLRGLGVELPMMYRLGYRNANCIGCPKGQQGYWNKIRVDFPEVFDRMAKLERDIGAAINKTYKGGKRERIFLDELDPDAGRYEDMDLSCGFDCLLKD